MNNGALARKVFRLPFRLNIVQLPIMSRPRKVKVNRL